MKIVVMTGCIIKKCSISHFWINFTFTRSWYAFTFSGNICSEKRYTQVGLKFRMIILRSRLHKYRRQEFIPWVKSRIHTLGEYTHSYPSYEDIHLKSGRKHEFIPYLWGHASIPWEKARIHILGEVTHSYHIYEDTHSYP